MNTPSSAPALHFPWGSELPALGRTIEVAEGVHWLRMALPFALDHINLWLLRDQMPDPRDPSRLREGWTVVDCGIDNPATREAWGQVAEQVLQGLPILRVLVTHMHPDHMGLAHWLCEQWQAPLWMNTTEYQSALLACSGASNFGGDKTQAFFAEHGWTSPEDMAQVRDRVGYYSGMVPRVPDAYHRMMDGQTVHIGQRQWRCISGYGHSPEHIALHAEDGDLLISGDMLLPSISTNVSVYSQEPDSNALQWFLDSLARMEDIPDSCLVLPSHGRPFKGAKLRISQYQEHHRERLEDLLQACTDSPRCAHEMLPVLFKRALNLHQTTFAMGEAIAHLNALWHAGQVRRQLDADGIYRFQSSGVPRAA
jgi:glyoxylase-like metal-dependent hydrolase (beta-lactamase superfamily II)